MGGVTGGGVAVYSLRDDGSWALAQALAPTGGGPSFGAALALTAARPRAGGGVACVLLVAAPGSGDAFFYDCNGTGCALPPQRVPAAASGGAAACAVTPGAAVALSENGTFVAATAASAGLCGRVQVFRRVAGVWGAAAGDSVTVAGAAVDWGVSLAIGGPWVAVGDPNGLLCDAGGGGCTYGAALILRVDGGGVTTVVGRSAPGDASLPLGAAAGVGVAQWGRALAVVLDAPSSLDVAAAAPGFRLVVGAPDAPAMDFVPSVGAVSVLYFPSGSLPSSPNASRVVLPAAEVTMYGAAPARYDRFGEVLAADPVSHMLVVGAPQAHGESGALYVYGTARGALFGLLQRRPWPARGGGVGVSSTTLLACANDTGCTAVPLTHFCGVAAGGATGAPRVGLSACLVQLTPDSATAYVGAAGVGGGGAGEPAAAAGAVLVYSLANMSWSLTPVLLAAGVHASCGTAVAATPSVAFVGCPGLGKYKYKYKYKYKI